ncbi:DUF2358 domain-containing protein [Umezakia ovalisporum]|jgi:hypothetical protein|uniref:DUF2358 domain-containing protein n=2 Tax=Umezakia ovalisporum TaxID=75695 RepID=A0AA43GWV4_9CYAN|nr:DUF2358 domain-containing protein [Umezakia ovalisporum]MDH6056483.1 DUF2358 domain-containing protein [Umezakia ovalisporum FSS-43]MDH6062268.1 DUF2358 domain-containing protein [Umezakia ovalisporum FSS-62]MDH6067871.1 DUF2358 domain-containing protein [Umezakia ovalisporum APH033B]MDH6072773.1 DUF2358 domain-containing protein [Umezakia ovalisporum CobakiLakeA]MDH6073614.1 DUF2358 domain-containing protein [Umezakia ovalisporum CS-1034]
MDIIQILTQDYHRFPANQTYSIYDENVYFQDPLTKFRGVKRYEQMIKFIQTWFINPHMDLHDIQRSQDTIKTEWTLSWNTPLPWKPRISISGWSELSLNSDNFIISHIDYWYCSPLEVIKQHFFAIRT